MDTLRIMQNLPFGIDTENRDLASALFKPWRRIAETGKPTGRVNFLFLDTGEALPSRFRGALRAWWLTITGAPESIYARTLLRVLGGLCYTPTGQILYFPGFKGTRLTAYEHGGRAVKARDPFPTDHFSLEPTGDRWHITPSDTSKLKREVNLKAFRVSSDMIHWFGLSVQRAEEFESVCRRNIWEFPCPSSDSRRRLEDIISARDGAQFHIITPRDIGVTHGPSYWHFQFLVKLGSAKLQLPREVIGFPPVPIVSVNGPTKDIPVRAHEVRIPEFNGAVVVLATRLPGQLIDPVVLTHS